MNQSGIRRRHPRLQTDDVRGGVSVAATHDHHEDKQPSNDDKLVIVESDTSHILAEGITGRLFGLFSAKDKKDRGDACTTNRPHDSTCVGAAQGSSSPTSEHDLPGSNSYSSTSAPLDLSEALHGSSSMYASSTNGADDDAHRRHDESSSKPLDVTAKVTLLDKSRSVPQKHDTSSTKDDSLPWESCSDEEGDDENDVNDDASHSSEPSGDLFTIIEHFKKRDRILNRLLDGKVASYCAMMLSNEMAARQKILQRFHHQQQQQQQENRAIDPSALRTTKVGEDHIRIRSSSSSNSGGGEQLSGKEERPEWNALQSLKHLMLFEYHHSLEGVWFAIWYCLGNAALFSLVDLSLSNSLTTMTWNQRHAIAIIVALVMMRADGYLWDWLSSHSKKQVQFDMHNRRVLGYWDANLLTSFRQGALSRIKPLTSMVAFYLLFLSVMYFYYQLFYIWAAWFGGFQQFLQQAIGCKDAFVGMVTTDGSLFWDDEGKVDPVPLWQYYICQPVEVPVAPEPLPLSTEPIFLQVVFHSISTVIAALIMTKSQVGLFSL